ncbi:SHOCT domain-containing protein [Halorubrum sp. LN27]|uniref:SHOCT domain-containing protein n=1 Tax=Halorubrum sp. LN27 TaxID=2801032 RepID=UPI001F16A7D6|nr:SHOCT domain-containing protein [Halorubrum sp. LN27]
MIGSSAMTGGAGMMGGMGVWMFVFPLLMLVTVAALAAVGVLGIRALASQGDDGSADAEPDESPVELLQRRYAEGELTEAEFERELERELERESGEGVNARGSGDPDRTREAERAGRD